MSVGDGLVNYVMLCACTATSLFCRSLDELFAADFKLWKLFR